MKIVLVVIVFCAVIANTQSENGYNGRPYGPYMQGYTRIKRVKYSNPPQRFYSRPPPSFTNQAVFSYTPPPGYMTENDEQQYPGNPYPGNSYLGNSRPKVSKRPTNEGLGEEDLQNFVKYLSKQDLDKILEFAGHNRDRPTIDDHRNINNNIQDLETYSSKPNEEDSKIFSALVKEIDLEPKFNQEKKSRNEYKNNPANYGAGSAALYGQFNDYQDKKAINEYSNNQASYKTEPTPLSAYTDSQNHVYNAPLDNQESMRQDTYSNTQNNAITDSKVMPEEILPRPVNLRDDQELDVSFTHNVPKVAKADHSYKLENFGDLPLMNYNSKLDTVSSYHVPHYTVTSNAKPPSSYAVPPPSYSSSSSVPAVEPAPPPSAAKEQSDAHLKAVRIWSHRSKGTAYTLHDDGTLSLEKPGRPKGGYEY